MISIDRINAGIIENIRKIYPDIPFTAQEKIEEIRRPAFKLILDEIKAERYTIGSVRRVFPVELVYFASDVQRPKLECLEVYEKLEPLLFKFADKVEANVNSTDAVLVMDLEIAETGELGDVDIYPDSGEYYSGDMETLEI
ncbi:MAG: hypothetical protein HFE63_00990 [Clostridiales bacterium]|nr:hypothetical protein [Clostridiales bacterium]